MKQINIARDSNGKVTFAPVSIDLSENVFFTNLDPDAAHWPYVDKTAFPDLCDNELGPAPSPNSSQCTVKPPAVLTPPNNKVLYGCHIKGHENEQGIISVFAQLAAPANTTLAPASKGQKIQTPQQVVTGGQSPYLISSAQFQVVDINNKVIASGSGIGPGLQLSPDQTNSGGITVTGTPTLSGTYQFTFSVDDAMKRNLQQVQYSMKVS
jgi:hypothetical protein